MTHTESATLHLAFADRYPQLTPGITYLAQLEASIDEPFPTVGDRLFLPAEDGKSIAVMIEGRDFFYSKDEYGNDKLDTITCWCRRLEGADTSHKVFGHR